MNGVVQRIVVDQVTGARKGFGFIKPSAAGEDVFFHSSCLTADNHKRFAQVEEGDRCEFDLDPSSTKGPRAMNLRILD